jgi:hypothetical protein
MDTSQIQDVAESSARDLTAKVSALSSKLPPSAIVGLALGGVALSAGIVVLGPRKILSTAILLWGPVMMLYGLYNRLNKTADAPAADLYH